MGCGNWPFCNNAQSCSNSAVCNSAQASTKRRCFFGPIAGDQFYRFNAKHSRFASVIGMEVRRVMLSAGLEVHTNDDAKKPG